MSLKDYGIKEDTPIQEAVQKEREFWNGKGDETMGPLSAKEIKSYLLRAFKIADRHISDTLVGDNILDIGCGIGRLCHALLEYNIPYTGVDIAPNLLDRARKSFKGKKDISFIEIEDTLPNKEYDIIMCYSVFTHITKNQIVHYLKEFNRVLKKDGIVLVSILGKEYNDPHTTIRTLDHTWFLKQLRDNELLVLGSVYVPDSGFYQTLYVAKKMKE